MVANTMHIIYSERTKLDYVMKPGRQIDIFVLCAEFAYTHAKAHAHAETGCMNLQVMEIAGTGF